MAASIIVKFGGNLDDLKKAIDEGKVKIEQSTNAIDRLANKLQGSQAVAAAKNWAAAIEKIGGASKLTEKDQIRANAVMEKALGYYKATGTEASKIPPEFQKIADATKQMTVAAEAHGLSFGKMALGFVGAATAADLLVKVGGQILGAMKAIGSYVPEATMRVAETGHEFEVLSNKTAMSVEALSAFKFMASQGGTNLEAITTSVYRMQVAIGKGGEEVDKALAHLGLSARELKTLAPDQMFLKVMDAIRQLPNAADQAAAGQALMSRGYREIAQLSRENLPGMIEQAKKLGLVWSTEDAVAAGELVHATERIGMIFGKLETQIGKALIPMALTLATAFEKNLIDAFAASGLSVAQWQQIFETVMEGVVTSLRLFVPVAVEVTKSVTQLIGLMVKDSVVALEVLNSAMITIADGLSHLPGKAGKDALAWSAALRMSQADLDKMFIAVTTGASGATKALDAIGAAADKSLAGFKDAYAATKAQIAAAATAHRKALEVGAAIIGEDEKAVKAGVKAFDKWIDAIHDVQDAVVKMHGEIAKEVGKSIEELLKIKTFGAGGGLPFLGWAPAIPPLASRSLEDYARSQPGQIPGGAPTVTGNMPEATREVVTLQNALRGLTQAFSELAQISGGTFGGIVRGVGQVIGSFSLMEEGFKAFEAGSAAMEDAADSAERMAAGIQMAAGAMSMSVSMIGIVLSIANAFDSAQAKINATIKASDNARKSFVAQQGGVDALTQSLAITGVQWQAWETYLKSIRDNATLTEHAIATLTGVLDSLKARQAAAQSAVALTGQLIEGWLKPIRDAQAGIEGAWKELDSLAASGNADPLELGEAKKKIDEFEAALKALAAGGQETFNSLAAYAVASFGAAFKTTGDFYGSLQAIGSILDGLAEGLKTLGLESGGAIAELLGLRGVQQEFKALLDPLSLATQILKQVGLAGVFSQDAMSALGRDALKAFNAMKAGGKDAKTSMVLMQPTLQTLWQAWKDGKIAIDDETLAMLRQAQEYGLVGADHKSVNDQMLDAFKELKDAIDKMTTAISDWGSAAEAAFSRAREGAISYGKAVPRGTVSIPTVPPPPGTGDWDDGGGGAGTEDGHARPRGHFGGIAHRWPVAVIVAHAGLAPDEFPAILQTGEGVLSRRGMSTVGAAAVRAFNQGQAVPADALGSAAGATVNLYAISAMDGTDVERVLIRHGATALTKSTRTNAFHANPELKHALKALLDL